MTIYSDYRPWYKLLMHCILLQNAWHGQLTSVRQRKKLGGNSGNMIYKLSGEEC